MKERSILFSGPMVRAILDGRKSMTRRVVKAKLFEPLMEPAFAPGIGIWRGADNKQVRCPYGAPGDRLWLRETWRTEELEADDEQSGCSAGTDGVRFRADSVFASIENTRDASERWVETHRADGGQTLIRPWRSPIHMPRWASRITLELTEVRVERVQDISTVDAMAEGADPRPVATGDLSYTHGFRVLWDSLNAKRGFGWETNPYVWAISFRRVEAQEVAA